MSSTIYDGALDPGRTGPVRPRPSLLLSARASRARWLIGALGRLLLLLITSSSALAVLFIFLFIGWDALPFFFDRGAGLWFRLREFFAGLRWDPSGASPSFGVLPILVGSGLVTLGATVVAVPLGVAAAVCLSDVVPFWLRQVIKPVIEVLAAIPSVAFGFFSLIVFAPLLQNHGGALLTVGWACIATPVAALGVFVLSDVLAGRLAGEHSYKRTRITVGVVLGAAALAVLLIVALRLSDLAIHSGVNALNVSIILGIMALPTIISVSEDALQAAGRELREGAYALGSTRAEVLLRVVVPAAGSGICAAIILGIMRAIGETMVVWMAAGNASQIPSPWYNLLQPVRTLTATIAGEMGEADQMTGSARYHVLWAMALVLLLIAFVCNLASEWVARRSLRKSR